MEGATHIRAQRTRIRSLGRDRCSNAGTKPRLDSLRDMGFDELEPQGHNRLPAYCHLRMCQARVVQTVLSMDVRQPSSDEALPRPEQPTKCPIGLTRLMAW
jgi:hypothetical protein